MMLPSAQQSSTHITIHHQPPSALVHNRWDESFNSHDGRKNSRMSDCDGHWTVFVFYFFSNLRHGICCCINTEASILIHISARSTALLKAVFHVPLLYFEHLPLQRSLHGPGVCNVCASVRYKGPKSIYLLRIETSHDIVNMFFFFFGGGGGVTEGAFIQSVPRAPLRHNPSLAAAYFDKTENFLA